jgi:molecular chaperone DnaK (HSP70)
MALSAIDEKKTDILDITQILSEETLGEKKLLPSAYYIPNPNEFGGNIPCLPWQKRSTYLTGYFARQHGETTVNRLVTSAKSWLCDRRFDPSKAILPWASEIEEGLASPIQVSEALLEHLKESFLHNTKDLENGPTLENTALTLTVPASFDEIARNLTYEAAEKAGWKNITLLEEPQAAFYSWIEQENSAWRDQIKAGDLILVCDMGGGTSDMTLIAVSENNGELTLNRICVGNHLLLGGDNIDLALAYTLKFQAEAEGKTIDDSQLRELIYGVRNAKEKFSEDDSIDSIPLSVTSKGSGLFASAISFELTRETFESVIDGFLPLSEITDLPSEDLQSGLQELGLKYEAEPIISKHIAAFLHRCRDAIANSDDLKQQLELDDSKLKQPYLTPTAVLFNGGVFNSNQIKSRVFEILSSWNKKTELRELTGNSLDLAVARGAASYGRTKHSGSGLRIKAGSAQSYYVGVESSMPAIPGFKPPISAICVVPYAMEEGAEQILESRSFGLVTGKKVSFRFFSSKTRTQDVLGTMVPNAEKELEESEKLQVELNSGNKEENGQIVPVLLHTKLNELGTMELWMQNPETNQKWKLEFDIRTE